MDAKLYLFYRQPGVALESPPTRPAGGGIFSTLACMALPLLQGVGSKVLRVAVRTLRDVWGHQRTLGASLLEHTTRELRTPSEINNISGNRKRKRALEIFLKRRRKEE